eukprot:6585713-Prymnesium_polylepis.1
MPQRRIAGSRHAGAIRLPILRDPPPTAWSFHKGALRRRGGTPRTQQSVQVAAAGHPLGGTVSPHPKACRVAHREGRHPER